MEHPITPPDELVNQWFKKACKDPYNGGKFIMAQTLKDFANSAARWGADQELEACCEWLDRRLFGRDEIAELRAARRPKAPSKADLALAKLTSLEELAQAMGHSPDDTIRRALERLKELEAAQ